MRVLPPFRCDSADIQTTSGFHRALQAITGLLLIGGVTVTGYSQDFPNRGSFNLNNALYSDRFNAIRVDGLAPGDQFGILVSDAGDLNGDDFDDFLIGAQPEGERRRFGEFHVIFGSSEFNQLETPIINVADVGTDASSISGLTFRLSEDYGSGGFSASSAGDVNADGFDDLLIGAPFRGPRNDNVGVTYLVFGSADMANMPASVINLSTLNSNNPDADGLVIKGVDLGDQSGRGVSAADVNGDGISDLLITAPGAGPDPIGVPGEVPGETYIIFGRPDLASQPDSEINLSSLRSNNSEPPGLVIRGISPGFSVSNAGDINDDGVEDILIGAFTAETNNHPSSGLTYLIFGNTEWDATSSQIINLSSLNTDSPELNGLIINGLDSDDFSGRAVSRAGDINKDGIDDLLIGAPSASHNGNFAVGEAFVLFGDTALSERSSPIINLFSLTTENPNTPGLLFRGIDEAGHQAGFSVSDIGDINNDSYNDIIIGTASDASLGAGISYVIFGNPELDSLSSAIINLSSIPTIDPDVAGFAFRGNSETLAGQDVSKAGDINGDGAADFLIGAAGSGASDEFAGSAYLIFGTPEPPFEVPALNPWALWAMGLLAVFLGLLSWRRRA